MARQAAVPPFALLEMPDQDLVRYTRKLKIARPRIKTLLGRSVTFGGALALTAYATREMIAIVSIGGVTVLQGVMVVLFAITFGWIALAAAGAVAGVLFGGVRRNARADLRVEQRTALVMPICNEEPARSFASLQAMAESLIDLDEAAGFEVFILSDTSNPAIYVHETAAFHALREALGDRMRVWYRRRVENAGRKAGNVREFVTRWGGRYDFMIVLDADSILAPETLVTLVREMAANPRLGLLQTVPRLCGLAGRRRQLLGPQRDRPRAGIRVCGRVAGLARAQAVRRHDHVARLRRGGAPAPRRLVRAHAADAPGVVGGEPAVAARRGCARPALGAGQHSASRGDRQPRAHLAEPRAHLHRRDELPRLAAVARADCRRPRSHGPHRDRAVRVLHRRAVVVPALAAVRQRANDRAVHRFDGDTVHAEDPGRAARAREPRAAPVGGRGARGVRRRRGDGPVGAVRADHDDDSEPAGVGNPAWPGLGLVDAEPQERRHPLAHAASPALGAHGGGRLGRGGARVHLDAVARVDGAGPDRARARVAAVGRERQRAARDAHAALGIPRDAGGGCSAGSHRAAQCARGAARGAARPRDDRELAARRERAAAPLRRGGAAAAGSARTARRVVHVGAREGHRRSERYGGARVADPARTARGARRPRLVPRARAPRAGRRAHARSACASFGLSASISPRTAAIGGFAGAGARH